MDTTQETRYHREVRATLDQVVELLDKQALVKELSSKQATHQQALVDTLVVRQQAAEIERRIEQLHPADLAFLIEGLPPARRKAVWDLVGRERRGAVLIELSDAVRESLFAEMQESEIIGALEHLASDDIADLVPSLPPDVVPALLRALDRKDRTEVQTVLSFPPGSVGSLMELDVPSIHGDAQVDMALRQIRRRGGLPERMDQLFVVDRTGALIGALPLRHLLIHEPEVAVGAIMTPGLVSFYTHDSANEAVQSFERYDLITAPVVNLHRQLVGVLTVDAVMDHIHEAAQRERLKQVGLREDEDLFAPIWKSGRNRWAWLAINLVAALVASRVIGAFEGTIDKLVALAALMPIIASVGGNTGNQTVALVIRGLALDQIGPANLSRFLRKELGIGLMNGVIWGTVVGLFALAIYEQPPLAGLMAGAMALNLAIASVAGVLIPYGLHKLGRDPVMGSSVILTAITDSMGFFIFLGLAALFLV